MHIHEDRVDRVDHPARTVTSIHTAVAGAMANRKLALFRRENKNNTSLLFYIKKLAKNLNSSYKSPRFASHTETSIAVILDFKYQLGALTQALPLSQRKQLPASTVVYCHSV